MTDAPPQVPALVSTGTFDVAADPSAELANVASAVFPTQRNLIFDPLLGSSVLAHLDLLPYPARVKLSPIVQCKNKRRVYRSSGDFLQWQLGGSRSSAETASGPK